MYIDLKHPLFCSPIRKLVSRVLQRTISSWSACHHRERCYLSNSQDYKSSTSILRVEMFIFLLNKTFWSQKTFDRTGKKKTERKIQKVIRFTRIFEKPSLAELLFEIWYHIWLSISKEGVLIAVIIFSKVIQFSIANHSYQVMYSLDEIWSKCQKNLWSIFAYFVLSNHSLRYKQTIISSDENNCRTSNPHRNLPALSKFCYLKLKCKCLHF